MYCDELWEIVGEDVAEFVCDWLKEPRDRRTGDRGITIGETVWCECNADIDGDTARRFDGA